jgi:hypothetical protein
MSLSPRRIALQGIGFTPIQVAVQGLYAQNEPQNGPSGGANWTRGYKPLHDYLQPPRRSRRDEILFLRG